MEYAYPSRDVVEAVAAAVLDVLRNHKHIYNHSLRYLPQRSQLEAARRIAKAALWTVWQKSDDPVEALAERVAERAETLIAAGEGEKRKPPWRRPEYGQIESYSLLKRKYAAK
jgi:hypothetical protein